METVVALTFAALTESAPTSTQEAKPLVLESPNTTKGFNVNALRTDATTDEEGRFYAYLLATLTGAWNVGYVSVACTSITMDTNCNCKGSACGRAYPETVEITLPFTGELVFMK